MCVAVLGGLLTDIGPWYKGLLQPAFKPPDAWFGPVWTLIFILAAAAGAVAWKQAPDRTKRYWLVGLFALNAGLNSLWSWLFFKLQRPDWALLEVGFLWLSIAALMWTMKSYSRRASALLLPIFTVGVFRHRDQLRHRATQRAVQPGCVIRPF
jgi:benzodiazapine receptor